MKNSSRKLNLNLSWRNKNNVSRQGNNNFAPYAISDQKLCIIAVIMIAQFAVKRIIYFENDKWQLDFSVPPTRLLQ
jgi:hypothetical protein